MDATAVTEEQVVARIERLPISGWYARVISTVASAHFFDAFDSLTIAFVLPVLVGLWHITPGEIGWLISAGYIGQLIGALAFGWMAERFGRLKVLQFSLGLIAIFAGACALAWNYSSFFWFRSIQGLGLGAEVPVAATYMNEFTKAKYRGRLIMALQSMFGVGIAVTSVIAAWIVPTFGWQSMFLLGTVPVLLAFALRWLVPESPRWLASHGQLAQADTVLARLEKEASRGGTRPLPPLPVHIPPVSRETATWSDLFKGIYLKRTLTAWMLAFCTSVIGYGLVLWMPTIARTVYNLPVAEALRFGVIINVVGLAGPIVCLLLIDFIGRKASFLIAFLGGFAGMFALWLIGDARTATQVITLGTLSYFFIGFLLTGLYVYIPETYPTRMRALGTGAASSWLRIASIVGPSAVGLILSHGGIGTVFLMFGLVSLAGAVVVVLMMIETRRKILEEISP
jgi:MFS transporter, putative metabolite:H+ symporter